MPASRSPTATSPRTTRLTSCARVSAVSQVGHHGQWRHSVIRDGCASAGARSAAAVATAMRSATRASYSVNVDAPARPVACPQVVPDDDVGVEPDHAAPAAVRPRRAAGAQPAARRSRCRWASRSRSRGCDRTRRAPIDRGRARPRPRERRRDRALPRIGDPVAHHDDRHVPALGHAHEQIGGGAPGAGRGGQQRTPDQGRPLGDGLGGDPLRVGIGRDDEAAGLAHDDRRDARPVPRRIRRAAARAPDRAARAAGRRHRDRGRGGCADGSARDPWRRAPRLLCGRGRAARSRSRIRG